MNQKNAYFWGATSKDFLIELLLAEQVMLSTTDTVLGLGGILTQGVVDRFNDLKGRSGKPYLILISDVQKIWHFAESDNREYIKKIAQRYWPGPLTLIVKAKKSVPTFMQSKDGTIALRVPNHPGLLEVLEGLEGLFSTSANQASQPVPENLDQVPANIKDAVDVIVLDEQISSSNLPSTIVDVSPGC